MRRILYILALLLVSSPATANPIKLTFLHVNDVYEYAPIDGKGGLAELATLVDAERARNPNSLFTFGGDLLSPSVASSITKGRHMVEFANVLGVDAAALGNHEFDFGIANLTERVKESRFPWLAANLTGDNVGLAGVLPYVIKTVGGVKVALFGILTRETSHLVPGGGVTFAPEITAARQTIVEIRREGADVIVALTHLDLAQDLEIAREVKGIDLILGGHDHEAVSHVENGVLVLKAGANAQWLAVVDLTVSKDASSGTVKVVPPEWRFLSTFGVAPSPRLAPLVIAENNRLDKDLDQPIGRLNTPMDSRGAVVRTAEAAIGNLFADALRSRLGADVAFINGGGIRANRQYPVGTTLTRRDILAEMPFGNIVMAVEVSGAQILELLEHGLSAIEHKAGRFPQVSGMTVTYDPKSSPAGRVVAVTIGGRPLDRAATYRLATTDYLARGGDGFATLQRAKVLVNAEGGPLLANVVTDYIVTAKEVAPKVEGRIKSTADEDQRR